MTTLKTKIDKLAQFTKDELIKEYKEKGPKPSFSTHEILGIITEEYYELIEAVKSNDLTNIKKELRDVMIATMHGILSIENWSNNEPNRNYKK